MEKKSYICEEDDILDEFNNLYESAKEDLHSDIQEIDLKSPQYKKDKEINTLS